jgi:hypothetical protein
MKTRSLLTLVAAAALLTSCQGFAPLRTAQQICSFIPPLSQNSQPNTPPAPPSEEMTEARKKALSEMNLDTK